MNRRGFLFGAGATIAIVAAPNLMRIAAPTYTWRLRSASIILTDEFYDKLVDPPIGFDPGALDSHTILYDGARGGGKTLSISFYREVMRAVWSDVPHRA